MKLSVILQLIKILLAVSDQVVTAIADSNIPKDTQPEIEKELDAAVKTMHRAKELIPVPPVSQ